MNFGISVSLNTRSQIIVWCSLVCKCKQKVIYTTIYAWKHQSPGFKRSAKTLLYRYIWIHYLKNEEIKYLNLDCKFQSTRTEDYKLYNRSKFSLDITYFNNLKKANISKSPMVELRINKIPFDIKVCFPPFYYGQ